MNFITPTSVGKPQHFPRCLTESLTSQMGASAVSLTEIISAPTVSALPPCHILTSLINYIWLKDWIFVCPFKFTFRASYSCSSWLSLKSFTLPSESWRLINNIPVSQCLILSAWCWGVRTEPPTFMRQWLEGMWELYFPPDVYRDDDMYVLYGNLYCLSVDIA